ncbi:MAG: hypothetical protein ABSF29_16025, partial [Tepidisphaeraceae bacterium]
SSPSPAAAQLAFVQQPSDSSAGRALNPALVVDVEDSDGDSVTTDHSTVTISVSSGPGTPSGTLTVSAVDGVATISDVTIDTAGTYTLTATDGALTSATSARFTVAPAAAEQLVFVQQPTSTNAGSTINPAVTVDVEDQFGNLVSTDSSSVTLTPATGPGALSGTTTVSAVDGIATFSNLSLSAGGDYMLRATDGYLTSATSDSFTIAAAGPAMLVFGQQPTNVTAGSLLTPDVTVYIEDANGNLVTTGNSSVTLSVASGSGTLSGTLTVAAVNGVATFSSLVIDKAGADTLSAADGNLASATSAQFSVAPAAPSQMLIVDQQFVAQQYGSVSLDTILVLEDQFGNIATNSSSSVTVTAHSGSGNVPVSGPLTAPVVNGFAQFPDLSPGQSGAYTFTFADGSLSVSTTTTFEVLDIPLKWRDWFGSILLPSSVNISQAQSDAESHATLTAPVSDASDFVAASQRPPVSENVLDVLDSPISNSDASTILED